MVQDERLHDWTYFEVNRMAAGSSLALLPGADTALAERVSLRMERVEERLREVVATDDAMVTWTARHLMDAGGKRVRPLLTLLAGEIGAAETGVAEPGESVVDAAVLVELTHLATLYHDDVMDDAPTRRGASTAHEVWSNSIAILTGDFLFARASALSAHLGPDAVRTHAGTFERLCMGQLHETVGPSESADPFAHYLEVLADKTASLIAAAGDLGAMTAGGSAATRDALRAYGEKVGVAFQLADDVLDLRADPAVSGKTPGTDLREGIPTMPTLLLRQRHADGDASPSTDSLVAALDGDLSSDAVLDEVLDRLRSDPAVAETQTMAEQMARDAIDLLGPLPACPARDALAQLTMTLVQRDA